MKYKICTGYRVSKAKNKYFRISEKIYENINGMNLISFLVFKVDGCKVAIDNSSGQL
jgi:hypothetical protein